MYKLAFAILFCLSPIVFAQKILFIGDSIGAAYGVSGESWVDIAQRKINEEQADLIIENISLSGSTTLSGGQILAKYIAENPNCDAVVIQLGGNDGLLGYPTQKIKLNLTKMISSLEEKNIPVLLIGITLPANYGSRRIAAIERMYKEIASLHKIPLMMLGDIFPMKDRATYLQFDNIHPNELAQPILGDIFANFLSESL